MLWDKHWQWILHLRPVYTRLWMCIEQNSMHIDRVHTVCTFVQSGLIPIHFQRWFRSGLIWIAQLRVARKDWKTVACMHMSTISTVSVFLWATWCVPCICSSQESIWLLAGVKFWRECYGSCVEVWPLKVNVHVWTCSRQCSVDAINAHWIRIGQFSYWTGFNLDSV